MDKVTVGTVVSVTAQWWLKFNTKVFRMHPWDGAICPHIIKVRYTVDGKDYFKRKWLSAGELVPSVGSEITVAYWEDKPGKAKVLG